MVDENGVVGTKAKTAPERVERVSPGDLMAVQLAASRAETALERLKSAKLQASLNVNPPLSAGDTFDLSTGVITRKARSLIDEIAAAGRGPRMELPLAPGVARPLAGTLMAVDAEGRAVPAGSAGGTAQVVATEEPSS